MRARVAALEDENKILRSEAECARVLEIISDGLLVITADDRIRFANQAACRVLGVAPTELHTKSMTTVGSILCGAGCREALDRARSESISTQWESGIPGERWFSIQADPLPGGEIVLTLRDISHHKWAEEDALRQAHEQLRAIVEASPLPIVAVTPDGIVTLWNRAAESVFGWTAAEAMGSYLPFIPAEKREEHRSMRDRDLRGEGFVGREIRRVRKDGKPIDLSVSTAPTRDQYGHVTGIMSVYQDITERKLADEAIAEKTAALARSNADLQQFAYAASHDLQEPLRTVSSFAQMLARRYQGQLGTDADEFITHMVNGTYRMSQLIQDLLTYSRVANQQPEPSAVDLNRTVQWAMENLHGAIENSSATVICSVLPTVAGDEIRLVQVFQNLISNSIKYRREDAAPRIEISAEPCGKEWRVCVRDNGQGFNPQYCERIFGIFKRLHGPEIPGTGIGLALCRRIVERHGGRIWAESVPNEGTCFYLTLPDAG